MAKSTATSSGKKGSSSRKLQGRGQPQGSKGSDLQQLETIFELMEKHEVTELEWDRGSEKLKVKTKHASADTALRSALSSLPDASSYRFAQETALKTEKAMQVVATAAPMSEPTAGPKSAVPSNQKQVASPFVGTFYRSPSPDADPYVREGQVVKRGDVLCIIEAMKLMNEIEAEFPGKIVSILVENGQPVEFGEPLFIIEP